MLNIFMAEIQKQRRSQLKDESLALTIWIRRQKAPNGPNLTGLLSSRYGISGSLPEGFMANGLLPLSSHGSPSLF